VSEKLQKSVGILLIFCDTCVKTAVCRWFKTYETSCMTCQGNCVQYRFEKTDLMKKNFVTYLKHFHIF
jgi:hypothetical protein